MFFLRTVLPATLVSTIWHRVLLLFWETGCDWARMGAVVSKADFWVYGVPLSLVPNFLACVVILFPIVWCLRQNRIWNLITASLAGYVSALPFIGLVALRPGPLRQD